MKKLALIAICLMMQTFTATADQVYFWKDKNGVTHFSDTPPIDKPAMTQQVDVINPPVSSPPIPQPTETPTAETEKKTDYTVSITSPINQETIRDNEGKIDVQVSIQPEAPQNGEVMQLLVDEKRFPCNIGSGTCQSFDIERGPHQLKTELFDKSGNLISSSEVVSVYLFKTTQLNRKLFLDATKSKTTNNNSDQSTTSDSSTQNTTNE